MHVLVLSHSGAQDHLGGSDLSLLSLLDHWQSQDSQLTVTLVSPSQGSAVAREARARDFTVETVSYEGWVRVVGPTDEADEPLRQHRGYYATQALVALLQRNPPNLVVTSTVVAPWAAFAAALVGIPHVWFVRESLQHARSVETTFGVEGTLRAIGELSVLVVANSRTLAAELSEHIPSEKLIYHYPTIDLDQLAQFAQERPRPATRASAGELAIVVVGRISRSKGQWRVVEALGLLRERGVKASATFVGLSVEPGANHLLTRRAKSLGVADAVTFVGEQYNPFPYVVAADVSVNPSDFESFGRTTVESMALGVPVIALARGAALELIVDGESGLHVDPDDVSELADRLEQLAREPQARERIAAAGRARAVELMESAQPQPLIDALVAASKARVVPRLQADLQWLSEPELLGPVEVRKLRAVSRLRRGRRRLGTLLRDPVGVLRRRWLRSRS